MKKAAFLLILIGFLCFLASPTLATKWTDTHLPGSPVYMDAGSSDEYDFTLDIKNDGFDPGFLGWGADDVLDYRIELYVSDEVPLFGDPWYDGLDWYGETETLSITTDFLWFEVEEESYEVDFNIGGWLTDDPLDYYSLAGLASINFDGTIGLNLTAAEGDFYFLKGYVIAGDHYPVPEPASMLLLGCGLLGLAGIGRKKIFKK
jgi:hypothetical protein